MLVTITIDDLDRKALIRMASECEVWRVNRYVYLVAMLGSALPSIGMLIYSVFLGGAERQLLESLFCLPVSIALLWMLRKRWGGPVWSTVAAKITAAIDGDASPPP